MKIDLLDVDRLISVNKLQEITSPWLMSNKMMYDPEGVLSSEIFGISKADRRGTFAYIDLVNPYIHPHIYGNILRRSYRKIISIISGQIRCNIVNGEIVDDNNGWTGILDLYKHWPEIDWNKSASANKKATSLLASLSRDRVFIKKLIICPPAYRDVMLAGTIDTSDHVDVLNKLYVKIIRSVSLLKEGGLFTRTQHSTHMKVQMTLVEILDHLKEQISKKYGIIRRYLIGKNVTYGTRSVISAFSYNNETIQENMVDISHAAVPISQCCSAFYPLIEAWIKNFFTMEILTNPNLISYYETESNRKIQCKLKDPELQFSDKSIKKLINDYLFNPDNRFKFITLKAIEETKNGEKEISCKLILKGKKITKNNIVTELNRYMTITDVLYLACVDICEKRHIMVTRYPIGTDKGLFFNKIRVRSTRKYIKVLFNDKEYPYYPDIDLNIKHDMIGVQFIDTLVYSNSLIEGMGADYDGDMVSIKGLWSDEANLEAENIMNQKTSALNITGNNSRVLAKEIFESYYELTKVISPQKDVNSADTNEYLSLSPDDLTRSKLVSMIADRSNTEKNKINIIKARYNTWDRFIIPKDYFYEGQPETKTTLGRFIFNKYILEGAGVIQQTDIILDLIDKNGLGKLDTLIGDLYLNDKINRAQFNRYIDRRDNLGYWINGMLAHTISAKMIKPLKEVEKRKIELMKKYEEEIKAGNIDVMNKIEKDLIAYAAELLKDDPGMDLYISGDLDFKNNYKKNSIVNGPVKNMITGEFDFISASFMNGIEVKDIPAHANGILAAQYPASITTKDSGYMGKKLLALLQMMEVDEPGTDCGTKNLIPITITNINRKELLYSYIQSGDQLILLTPENIDSYMNKVLMMRSPMSCITKKICNKCAGELFYKLGIKYIGLFSTQLSHSMLNLGLKMKHDTTVSLYHIDPDKVIEDIT